MRIEQIRMDAIEMTPQGFLRFPVFAGRTGIQTYLDKQGQVTREFRPSEEVFSEDTMMSLRNVPVTNDHPDTMVTPDNAKDLMVGFGSDHVDIVDNKFQKTYVTITDKDAIKDIRSGKLEVSLGYQARLDKVIGVHEGVQYDAIQRDIKINHLALVDKGRAGPEVRLRTDSYDAIMIDDDYIKTKSDNVEKDMAKMKIGDSEFEVEEKLKDAVEAEFKKMKDAEEEKAKEKEDMEKEKEDMEKEKDAEKEKADSLQAKLDALEEKENEVKLDSDMINKLVKERKSLETKASMFLDEEAMIKLDSADSLEIMKQSILATTKNDIDFTDKSEAYIKARFDAIVEMNSTFKKSANEASKALKNDKEVEEKKDSSAKRAERMKKDSEAWKNPIGRTK